MPAIKERDQALSILDLKLEELSIIYKTCYQSMGKGALLVYAEDIISEHIPSEMDYRTKKEMFEVFYNPKPQASLGGMLDNYNPKKEGVMALITSHANATFFVTFKFQ